MMSADAPPPQPAASSGLAEESTGQHLANAVNAQFKLHAKSMTWPARPRMILRAPRSRGGPSSTGCSSSA